MKLETTEERVLEAAKKSEAAKEILETLFPDVFAKGENIDIKPFKVDTNYGLVFIGQDFSINGLREQGLLLDKNYNWEFTKNCDYHVLIPTTK